LLQEPVPVTCRTSRTLGPGVLFLEQNAVASGAVLKPVTLNGNGGPAAHRLATFLASPSGQVNTEISRPLRHDLARVAGCSRSLNMTTWVSLVVTM